MRLTSIEFSFDPCNIYRDVPRGVGYPADARSVGDSHPSCLLYFNISSASLNRWTELALTDETCKKLKLNILFCFFVLSNIFDLIWFDLIWRSFVPLGGQWSSRVDTVRAVKDRYTDILEVLTRICLESKDQKESVCLINSDSPSYCG